MSAVRKVFCALSIYSRPGSVTIGDAHLLTPGLGVYLHIATPYIRANSKFLCIILYLLCDRAQHHLTHAQSEYLRIAHHINIKAECGGPQIDSTILIFCKCCRARAQPQRVLLCMRVLSSYFKEYIKSWVYQCANKWTALLLIIDTNIQHFLVKIQRCFEVR